MGADMPLGSVGDSSPLEQPKVQKRSEESLDMGKLKLSNLATNLIKKSSSLTSEGEGSSSLTIQAKHLSAAIQRLEKIAEGGEDLALKRLAFQEATNSNRPLDEVLPELRESAVEDVRTLLEETSTGQRLTIERHIGGLAEERGTVADLVSSRADPGSHEAMTAAGEKAARVADQNLIKVLGAHKSLSEGISGRKVELQEGDERVERIVTKSGLWSVGKTLGEGAFGAVQLIEREGVAEPSVLKTMKPGDESEKELIEQATNELEMTKLFSDHPQSVSVHHAELLTMTEGLEGTKSYGLLFEKLESDFESVIMGRLSEVNSGERAVLFSPSEQKAVARDLGNVLSMLADKGVVHRDLKMENFAVVTNEAGEVTGLKVFDFGLAMEEGVPETIGGSPLYISPEQFSSDAEVTCASDTYSVGNILSYVMLGAEPVIIPGRIPVARALFFKGSSAYANYNTEKLEKEIKDNDENLEKSALFAGAPEGSFRSVVKSMQRGKPSERISNQKYLAALKALDSAEERLGTEPPTISPDSLLDELKGEKEGDWKEFLVWRDASSNAPYEFKVTITDENGPCHQLDLFLTPEGVVPAGELAEGETPRTYGSIEELMEDRSALQQITMTAGNDRAVKQMRGTINEAVLKAELAEERRLKELEAVALRQELAAQITSDSQFETGRTVAPIMEELQKEPYILWQEEGAKELVYQLSYIDEDGEVETQKIYVGEDYGEEPQLKYRVGTLVRDVSGLKELLGEEALDIPAARKKP